MRLPLRLRLTLCRRAGALHASPRGPATYAAPAGAKALVAELQQRLVDEVAERDAEAALFSARLLEREKALSDWCAGRAGGTRCGVHPAWPRACHAAGGRAWHTGRVPLGAQWAGA
jgi:hypothetical protein